MAELVRSNDAEVSVSVVTTPEQLMALRETWEALFAITPGVSGFQSAAWVTQCWSQLSHPTDKLFIGVVRRGNVTVALFPTQLSKNGRLNFIGGEVSNYCGPLYDPTVLDDDVVSAWLTYLTAAGSVGAVDLSGLREDSPAFQLLRKSRSQRWGEPLVMQMLVCPEIDLTQGWDSVYHRRRPKSRKTWRAKRRALARLGELDFVETGDADEIATAMPRLIDLYRARWKGTRVAKSGAFSAQFERFQIEAAREAAETGNVLLSLLKLDGDIIAFNYGVRAANITSSYVLSHDGPFGSYSVGTLLLLKVLESAAHRGDPMYDFSLGDDEYKAIWATRQQAVFRLLWGRGRWTRLALSHARTRARSVPQLRRVWIEGVRAPFPQRREALASDAPDLLAGEDRWWFVYRVVHSTRELRLRPGGLRDIRRSFSPRLCGITIERNYRGDMLLLAEDENGLVGAIWQATKARRRMWVGEPPDIEAGATVYYHPVPCVGRRVEAFITGLSNDVPYLVATSRMLHNTEAIETLGSYSAKLEGTAPVPILHQDDAT